MYLVKRLHSLLLLKNLLSKIPSRVYLGGDGKDKFLFSGEINFNHREEAAVKSNTLAIL